MGVAAGTALGPYEIDAPLGARGMGEVGEMRGTRHIPKNRRDKSWLLIL